jgi:plastin-1
VDLPLGTGASKVAQQWQSKLDEKPPEPKIERGISKRFTSPLASQWEKNANTTTATTPGAKKDLDDLKALMAKEREQVLSPGGATAGVASFSTEEDDVEILINILNTHLKGEQISQRLPLKASSPNLWTDLSDGVALCKFFNKTIPDMLDVRVITMKVTERRDKVDNWNLCVQSARGAGCRLHDVKVDSLADGDPISIQKVIFQIAKIGLETDLKMFEEFLSEFIPDASDPDSLAGMSLDEILLKWINHILKKSGHSRRPVHNLTTDLQDSSVYIVLLNETLGLSLEQDSNELELAQSVVMSSAEINKGPVITLQGIVDGSYWQNCIFLASLLLTAADVDMN